MPIIFATYWIKSHLMQTIINWRRHYEKSGNSDYWASQDLEDIIMLFDGRPEIVQEVQSADSHLHDYLVIKIRQFLQDSRFLEALSEHFALDEVNQYY
ncbi:MAG: hypothetical protein ABFS56_14595 [Pseudomonadota bacterium]